MKKKRFILKKKQLVLAQTQVNPIFPFSPKNSHFQKLNFEKIATFFDKNVALDKNNVRRFFNFLIIQNLV